MQTPYEIAYKLACDELARLDLEDVAFNSSAKLKDGVIYLNFIDETFTIKERGRQIISSSIREMKINEKIIILHYLITSDGTALTGEEITLEEIPGASFYYPTYKTRTIDLITNKFSGSYDKFMSVVKNIGFNITKSVNSYRLKSFVFPNVPVSFILWLPADSSGAINADSLNILYDSSITHYLPLEDIIILTELISHKIIKSGK